MSDFITDLRLLLYNTYRTDWHSPAVLSRKGSWVYGVNHAASDQDFHAFVYPTMRDVVRGKTFVGNIHNGDDGQNLEGTIHDIRRLPEFVGKMNPAVLEMFASSADMFTDVGNDLSMFLSSVQNRNALLFSKPATFLFACAGNVQEKLFGLRKGTSSTQADVDRFGYDPKQAAHAFRYYSLAVDYRNMFDAYSNSIIMGNAADVLFYLQSGSMRRIIFENFKSGTIPVKYVEESLTVMNKEVYALAKESSSLPRTDGIHNTFQELVYADVEAHLKE